jgi:hypothetical protein
MCSSGTKIVFSSVPKPQSDQTFKGQSVKTEKKKRVPPCIALVDRYLKLKGLSVISTVMRRNASNGISAETSVLGYLNHYKTEQMDERCLELDGYHAQRPCDSEALPKTQTEQTLKGQLVDYPAKFAKQPTGLGSRGPYRM